MTCLQVKARAHGKRADWKWCCHERGQRLRSGAAWQLVPRGSWRRALTLLFVASEGRSTVE